MRFRELGHSNYMVYGIYENINASQEESIFISYLISSYRPGCWFPSLVLWLCWQVFVVAGLSLGTQGALSGAGFESTHPTPSPSHSMAAFNNLVRSGTCGSRVIC